MSRTSKSTSSGDIARSLEGLRMTAPHALTEGVIKRLGVGDRYVEIDSIAGPLYVAFNKRGIEFVLATALVDGDQSRFEAAFEERFGRRVTTADEPPRGLAEAIRTGNGKGLQYDLRSVTEFERAVLTKALEIPAGEVRTYSWVAKEIGRPRAVRAVGNALGDNPVPILIPCHRVVRSDGHTGNYGWGPQKKVEILHAEGVDVTELVRLEHAGVRFIGSDTTKIFCTPTCHNAKRITERHRVAFRSAAQAEAAGYRACKACRPAA
jgi:methylated-DNA-[protein]-cysteine S-methyltransferase